MAESNAKKEDILEKNITYEDYSRYINCLHVGVLFAHMRFFLFSNLT